MGKLLDRIAQFAIDHIDPKVARRMAALMLVISLVASVYLPFSGEPPVIYAQSSLALLFASLLALVEAQRWTKDDPEADPDQPDGG